MGFDVGNELANKEIAVAHAAVGGVDVEAALPFGRDDQEVGDLILPAEIFSNAPSSTLKQGLFIVAEPMQKIEHGIMPWRTAGSGGGVAGWQHHAVADDLSEDTALQCVAIDAVLSVGLAEQERNYEPYKPSTKTPHGISLLVAQRLHGIETRSAGCRVEA